MPIQLRTADRKRAALRVGVSGPSGAGKTYSALLLASGIASDWSKVCLIDSENGRGELYSDLGEYNIIDLKAPFTPESYIEAIQAAEAADIEVIVIDSISHEWEGPGGCLEINERLAESKFKGNTWAAWSETTPRHHKFIEAVVQSKCDVITTVRNKTATVQEGNKIKKVGTKEITRDGFEYELTVNFNIDRAGHYATASKDNTQLFDSRDPFIITAETGKEILNWKMSGKVDHTATKKLIAAHLKDIRTAQRQSWPIDLPTFSSEVLKYTQLELNEDNYVKIESVLAPVASDWRDNPLPEHVATDFPDDDIPPPAPTPVTPVTPQPGTTGAPVAQDPNHVTSHSPTTVLDRVAEFRKNRAAETAEPVVPTPVQQEPSEEPVIQTEPEPEPTTKAAEEPPVSVDDLTFLELQVALKDVGLKANGTKSELIKRLKNHIAST